MILKNIFYNNLFSVTSCIIYATTYITVHAQINAHTTLAKLFNPTNNLRHYHALLNRVSTFSTHVAFIQKLVFFTKSVKSFHLASIRDVHGQHGIVVLYLVFEKKNYEPRGCRKNYVKLKYLLTNKSRN